MQTKSRLAKPLKRTPILIGIVIAIAIAVGVGFYFWSSTTEERKVEPLEAVPLSASMLLEFVDMRAAITPLVELPYAQLVVSAPSLGLPFQRSVLLDSLVRGELSLEGASVLHSFHTVHGDSGMHVLTVVQPKAAIPNEDLEIILENVLTTSAFQASKVGTHKVLTHAAWGLSVAAVQGFIVVSDSPKLLAQSFEALETGKALHTDKRLQMARTAAGKNVQMNLFVRLPLRLFRASSLWNEMGDWIALDVSTEPEGPVMNGFSYTSDSVPTLLGLFHNQKPQQLTFQSAIPAQASSFLMFGVSDMQKLQHDYVQQLEQRGAAADYKSRIDTLNATLKLDVRQHFFPWMGKQFGTCVLATAMVQKSGSAFALFQANSPELADKLLHSLADKAGSDTATVRAMPIPGLLQLIFGEAMADIEGNYFTRYNDFIIFGSTAEAVQAYVIQLQADRTLANDASFATFMEQFSSSFNVFSYNRLLQAKQSIQAHLSSDGVRLWDNFHTLFEQLPAFGAQFSSTGKAFYTNVYWQYNPDWNSKSSNESVAGMDAQVVGRPLWMRNHLSKESEVFAQDASNNVYLFNQTGQELFKRSLSETIVGKAVQVGSKADASLNYLFSTSKQIHLWDRNGKDVAGFPINLESPLSAPMQVIDYDGKYEYRLLVACKNKRVYNFGLDGKQVKGWKFDKSSSPVTTAVAHLSAQKKDYLCVAESSGKIHLLERTGAKRVAIKEEIELSSNAVIQPFSSKNLKHAGFYVTDTQGTVHHIGLDGKVKQIELLKCSPEHQFMVADLNTDGEPEFVLSDLNVLKVFAASKKMIFEQRLSPGAVGPFFIELAKNRFGIGYSFLEDNQVMLFDATGVPVEGFPLTGSSPFDVVAMPTAQRLVVTGIDQGLSILIVD